MFLSVSGWEPFSAAKTDTSLRALSEFLALLWGAGFNKTLALYPPLTALSDVTSHALHALLCTFTLVWTSALLAGAALSEGWHANMASTKVTSGYSTHVIDKTQHYTGSLGGDAACDLTVSHVLFTGWDCPFISSFPQQVSLSYPLKENQSRLPAACANCFHSS